MVLKNAKAAARHMRLATLACFAIWACSASARTLAPEWPEPPPQTDTVPVVLLVDLGSGQTLLSRNPDKRFLPASMTKVMTAYVAFEEMRRGSLRRDREIKVKPEIAAEWNGKGTSMYLEAVEKVRVDDLLRGIMTASANDASVVLADGYAGSVKAWTFLMNDSARRLGMVGSHFATPNGWPDGGQTYVTATDLTRLGSAMIFNFPQEYARYSGHTSFKWNDRMLYSHDPVTGVIEGADGIKTGFTREAGYNFLGSAKRDGRRLVMVVGGARTDGQRAEASRALLEWGFSEWRARPLFAVGDRIAKALVQGGDARDVPLTTAYPIYATVPAAGKTSITLEVLYDGPIQAPISKGQQIASLQISQGSRPAGRVPLIAAKSVKEASAMDRFVNGFKNLFS